MVVAVAVDGVVDRAVVVVEVAAVAVAVVAVAADTTPGAIETHQLEGVLPHVTTFSDPGAAVPPASSWGVYSRLD